MLSSVTASPADSLVANVIGNGVGWYSMAAKRSFDAGGGCTTTLADVSTASDLEGDQEDSKDLLLSSTCSPTFGIHMCYVPLHGFSERAPSERPPISETPFIRGSRSLRVPSAARNWTRWAAPWNPRTHFPDSPPSSGIPP